MNQMLLKFKKFDIVPNGMIQGGWVSYSVDTETGNISFAYNVNVEVLFFPINFSDNGVLKVDPKALLSSSFKVGQRLEMGPVTAEVISIALGHGSAKVSILNNDINCVGTALFDLSGEYISLLSMTEAGTVKGYGVNLALNPE